MNATLIARRRLELGLSRGDLARITGLSWQLLQAIESSAEPPFVTLDAARRIARALAIDLDSIAADHEYAGPAPDDVRFVRLLASANDAHTLTELAQAMRWPLTRLADAVEQLELRLGPTGQILQHRAGRLRLTGRGQLCTTPELARLRARHEPITKEQAEVLRIVIIGSGRQQWWEHFSDEQRTAAARLCDHGMVAPAGNSLRLTDRAKFSLQPEISTRGDRPRQRSPATAAKTGS